MLQKIPLESLKTRNNRGPEHFYPSQHQPSYSGKNGGPANLNHPQICTDNRLFMYLRHLSRRLSNIQKRDKCKSIIYGSVIHNVSHDFLVDLSTGQTSKSYLFYRFSNGPWSSNLPKPCPEGQAPRMVLVFSYLK